MSMFGRGTLMRRSFTDNAVFPHTGAKGAGVETKNSCCPVFPLDAPTGSQENPEDVVVLQIAERFEVLP